MKQKDHDESSHEDELILDEDLKHRELMKITRQLKLEAFNSQLQEIYNSGLPYKRQKRKIYELQMPFIQDVHSHIVSALIKEALA